MPVSSPLELRFLSHLRSLGIGAEPTRLVVAVSGGCDSVTLLYLLRFAARHLPLTLTVAHLDHAMREGSAGDAEWVRGLCAAWELPFVTARLSRAPRGETEARAARHAFLRRVAGEAGAAHVVTAHHADDQAETVLFRALRGTGVAGLAGMPALSRSGILRPLLPFWRRELEEYAGSRRLRWREDESNLSTGPARNRIRREILPGIERTIAPAARRNLVALARLAGEAEAALEREAERALPLVAREEGGAIVLARAGMRSYDSAIGSRILRHLLRRFGVVPSWSGTRRALQFINHAPSGRELELPGGVRLRVEFETARLAPAGDPLTDEPLQLDSLGLDGEVERPLRVGGRAYRVRARVGRWTGETEDGWRAALPLHALHFPLLLRGWSAGDRIRTPGGTKTLKKLFLERRVPRSARHQLPVLADAHGSVLWVGGIGRSTAAPPTLGEDALLLTIGE